MGKLDRLLALLIVFTINASIDSFAQWECLLDEELKVTPFCPSGSYIPGCNADCDFRE